MANCYKTVSCIILMELSSFDGANQCVLFVGKLLFDLVFFMDVSYKSVRFLFS